VFVCWGANKHRNRHGKSSEPINHKTLTNQTKQTNKRKRKQLHVFGDDAAGRRAVSAQVPAAVSVWGGEREGVSVRFLDVLKDPQPL
jgi:hypothetical protein